ncbi:MAG: hypothetical protein LBK18_10155 [Prevotellaceae bacterium]|jgi:hypothetical protein|nr:hypothetical protein [Prevotellaceae bacterium]
MMIIANPIYDTVFKRLMENERVARFFIGTLLNREVASVEMLPQEFTYYKKKKKEKEKKGTETGAEEGAQLTIFRLDFMATIVTATGARSKVLIEVQKAHDEVDLMRFRSYLGEQYKKAEKASGKKVVLPITTIYVLGFKLPEVPTACVKVGRAYEDLVNNLSLKKRSPFIEKLTHDCYVVQVKRITERYQTRLDKLLSIFEQANFVGDTEAVKEFRHDPDDADVKEVTDILHHVGTDPAERKALDIEVEANRTFEEWLGKKYDDQRTIILEQGKTIAEKDETITAERKALAEKDAEMAKLLERISQLEQKR